METARFSQVLSRHRLIALDSCVMIYHLEGDESFAPAAGQVLSRVQQGRNSAVMSTLALLEIQVGPYRKDAQDLADRYYALLSAWPNCRWIPLTYPIADRAARLRAQYGIATPDAIHLATAIEAGAGLFVTNDTQLPKLGELTYLILGPA